MFAESDRRSKYKKGFGRAEQMSEEEERMGEIIKSGIQIMRDKEFPEHSHPG